MINHEKWHYGCHQTETYIKLNGVTVARSKNLRGLTTYARKFLPVMIETRKSPLNANNGELRITYADGAIGFAFFSCHSIMIDWLRNRRSWRHAEFKHYSGEMGYLTKPGIIGGAK